MGVLSIRLSAVPIGVPCIVQDIEAEESQRLRLFDLGFFQGSQVCPLYECYGGRTRVYAVKRTLIAIRASEADCILAKEEGHGK